MWISVPPSELATVGKALTAHSEIAFAAATTGTANLLASVVCKDAHAFYTYLTTKVAALSAIEHMETSPVIPHHQTRRDTGHAVRDSTRVFQVPWGSRWARRVSSGSRSRRMSR